MKASRTTLIAGTSERVDVMPHPRLAEALMIVRGHRASDGLADLSRDDIPEGLLAWGAIADVLDENTFRYGCFGHELCRIFGSDMTGRSPRDLQPAEFAEIILAQYRETVRRRRPLIHAIWSAAKPECLYFRLTVPLGAGRGDVARLWMTTALIEDFSFGVPLTAADLNPSLFASGSGGR